MFERFTNRARKVMQLANQEALRLDHAYIGTEHILLGLVKEGSGVAVAAVKTLGVEPYKITSEIERLVQESSEFYPNVRYPKVRYAQTRRAKKVIEYAMEEARNLKHDYVGTEHILLGLLREEEGVAAQVLMDFDLRLDKVRAEIQATLQSDEYSPQSRIKWVTDRPKDVEKPPEESPKTRPPAACPKCGEPHIVRVLWKCTYLFQQDQEEVDTGKAILGSCSDLAGPPWVCLRCSPAWSEVHALGMQDYQLQLAKEKAVASTDFETATTCRDAQADLRRQCSQIVEEILKNP